VQPYNSVKRTATEKSSSVMYPTSLIQEGQAASKINTAYTFIPCDMQSPHNVVITPVVYSTVSANGVAFHTTTVGAEITSLDTLSAVTNLDAHAESIAYIPGNLVKATLTDGTEKAYLCIEAHTSTAGPDFDTDYGLGYWLELSTTTFIKITHTAAGSSKNAFFHYCIIGE